MVEPTISIYRAMLIISYPVSKFKLLIINALSTPLPRVYFVMADPDLGCQATKSASWYWIKFVMLWHVVAEVFRLNTSAPTTTMP